MVRAPVALVSLVSMLVVVAVVGGAGAQPVAKKPTLDNGALTATEVVGLVETLADDPTRFEERDGMVVAKTVVVGGPWAALGLRVGDVVTAINGIETPDRKELRSALMLAHDHRVIYVELVRSKKPVLLRRVVTGTAPARPVDPSAVDDPGAAAAAVALAELMDRGIRKIDATTVEVSVELIDAVLANPMAIAKGARFMPSTTGGTSDGFRIYGMRPKSIYDRLGFSNGDKVQKVNGLDINSADRALEVYTQIRGADRLVFEMVRRGKPLTLTVVIRR